MSMMAEYFKEFLGDETFEDEHGFAVYRYLNADTVYIVHIYVAPEYRKKNIASTIADVVCEKAKQKGCKQVLGSVVLGAKHASTSMKVLLGYGMSLDKIENGMLIFSKGIV